MQKTERTFVILKPDAVQRGLIGEIIKRIEQKGLKISAMKTILATEEQVFEHYAKSDEWFSSKGQGIIENRKSAGMGIEKEPIEYGKDIVRALAKYMTAGPSIGIVVEGHSTVNVVTKLTGSTEPATADIGTVRGDFCIDTFSFANLDDRAVRNLIHCSEDLADAEREIKVWFTEEEIISYSVVGEKILYDVNLDGIME